MTSITGRDGLIVMDALATALVALEQLPDAKRPHSNMNDMRRLLAETGGAAVTALLAQATCRLNPDKDAKTIYRGYGIDVGEAGDPP